MNRILSEFSCSQNFEIESFVKNSAVDFAKKKISVTYLIIDQQGRLAAIFTLAHKALQISDAGLSSKVRSKIKRFSRLDEASDTYTASAFLIAQFSKNFKYDLNKYLTGNDLMDMVISVLKKVQMEIGGGIIYLECENKQPLLNFYQAEHNGFKPFNKRESEKDGVTYIQMLKLF